MSNPELPIAYLGQVAPMGLTIEVDQEDTDLDLSIVTAATYKVTKTNGQQLVWAATIASQSTTKITFFHVYSADGSDLNQLGDYVVFVAMAVPGGFEWSEPRVLRVVDPSKRPTC